MRIFHLFYILRRLMAPDSAPAPTLRPVPSYFLLFRNLKPAVTFLLIIFLFSLKPFWVYSQLHEKEAKKMIQTAVAYWMDGRPEDAIATLKYVIYMSSETSINIEALRELIVLLSSTGKNQEALPYLAKYKVLSPDDPYIEFEKGWNYLALEKYLDSRTSFENVILTTSSSDLIAHARFGAALAEIYLSGPVKGIEVLRSIYQKYPYLVSPAAHMISECYKKLKKRSHSVTFLKETLVYDPKNLQAEIDLAQIYENVNFKIQAWQTYYTLYQIDPYEPIFEKKIEKLSKSIKGNPENLLYWTRLSWPVHNVPVKIQGRHMINIGLYSNKEGVPSPVSRFSFICNSDFKLSDMKLGHITDGSANLQWNVSYNPFNRIYEVRDNFQRIVHQTRNGIRIVPKENGGVILIKNPLIIFKHGVNRGDKEIMGELSMFPEKEGYVLVNKTPLENCIPAIVSNLAGNRDTIEDLKALSIVVRTKAFKIKSISPHENDKFDFCDSGHCLNYPGLQAEHALAIKAVDLTKDKILFWGDKIADVEFHQACGGITDDGINDNGSNPKQMTPFNLHKWLFEFPPDELMCLPNNKSYSSGVYWTLFLDSKWIEERANRKYKIGKLKAIVPLKRNTLGKLSSIRLEGTANTKVVEGFDEISYVLSANTLRSAIWTIMPLYKGKYPYRFILKGVGTGHTKGICIYGAYNMAKNHAKKYQEILKHYFPLLKIKKITQK